MATKAGPNIITDGLVLNIDPANVKSYPAKDDPYRDQVSLLLDGTDLLDKSRNALTVTANGNAAVVSDSTFGSVYSFDGSGDYLLTSASALPSGTGDFTIQGWFNSLRGWQFDSNQTYIFIEGATGSSVMSFYNAQGEIKLANNSNGIGITFDPATYDMQPNIWYHIAVTRSAGFVRIFLNGSLAASGSLTTNFGTTTATYIGGAARSNSLSFYGYIVDLEVIKGVARYTSNFTPPSRISSPARISDIKNNSIGTLTNGPVFSNVQNGVMSFDGAGDYLDFPSNESFNFSNNNFYIESWIYLNQYPVNNNGYYISTIICKDQISNRSWDFFITGTSSANTTLLFTGFINNSSVQQANISYGFNLNTWYHVACSRVGNYIYLYVNGICINSGGTSFTATIQNTSSVVRIGAQVYTTYYYYFNGNIANLKVYKNRGLSADEVQKNYTATRKRFVETPKTIPGLQLWLDGADLSTMRQNSNGTTAVALNGDPVGYWGDKSGNGRHAIQATSASRPLLYSNQINGLPALQFDGSDDWLYTNTSGTVGTIINVYYHTNGGWGLYDGVFSIRTNTYLLNASSFCYSLGAPSNSYSTKISLHASPGNGNGVTCDDLPSPADSRINGQTAQSAFNYYTQGQTVSQLWNVIDSRFIPVSGTYNIGFGVDICCAGRYSPMKYVECLIYDRYLSDSELKTIYGYLNQKWAIF